MNLCHSCIDSVGKICHIWVHKGRKTQLRSVEGSTKSKPFGEIETQVSGTQDLRKRKQKRITILLLYWKIVYII